MRKPEIKNRNMKIGCRHEVMKAAVASFVVSAGLLCGAAEARRPVRGAARLTDIAALPVYDVGARIGYVGSIDPNGDNADWDWGEVQDENGEWILFEDEGPGCIYNFTQHRGEKSEEPVFRFYFDGAKKPQFEIRPSEFGTRAPFVRPLAGFLRPNFPFRIVRSFVPMEYRSSVRVTSTVRLRGGPPQGGWGHVVYHHYDSADGLVTFDGNADGRALAGLYAKPLALAADGVRTTDACELAPGSGLGLYAADGAQTLVETALDVCGLSAETCTNLWLTYAFDGRTTVEAPVGTFFGCEQPFHAVKRELALLTFDTSDPAVAHLSNRFPMPFFKSAAVRLENRGATPVRLRSAVVRTNGVLRYDPSVTGHFTAMPYLPKTRNRVRRNARIGRFVGRGQMVYGTLSGHDFVTIRETNSAGCEGDVRCFVDDMTVPRVQSDGSESWGSWGWGFDLPPQVQPFAAYDSAGKGNHFWSQVRLLIGDAYPFRRFLRFDLEHGNCNEHPESSTSGQCFGYVLMGMKSYGS